MTVLQAHFFKKATLNCKMVVITNSVAQKKPEGKDTSGHITQRANAPNGTIPTLYFATSSLRIHVEFLSNERGKEKDR